MSEKVVKEHIGKLDELRAALFFLKQENAEYVLLSDTNIIFNIDYRDVLELLRGKAVDPRDVIARIEAVTKEDTERVLREVFARPFAASAVGRNVESLRLL